MSFCTREFANQHHGRRGCPSLIVMSMKPLFIFTIDSCRIVVLGAVFNLPTCHFDMDLAVAQFTLAIERGGSMTFLPGHQLRVSIAR